MNVNDPIIVTYDRISDKKTEREISYFGWDSDSPIVAFFNYADCYRYAADILLETFKDKKTSISDLDRLGFSICSLYRQSIELSLKYLYMLCKQSQQNNNKFLCIGHRLLALWDTLYPLITTYTNDAKTIRYYVQEFEKFDPDSMLMRYPVNKKNEPNKHDQKLNIIIFAEAATKLQDELFSIGDRMRNNS